MPTLNLFQSIRAGFSSQIDEQAGIIRRVAVITEGPALGHGLMIDATTLRQIKTAAETYTGGLKVKMNHGSGVDAIVGFLTDFAIEGRKLVADLHLLKSAPQRSYVLEIAQTIADAIGLSVAFSGKSEDIGGVPYARCTEIYSCDLVGEPAANPSGLFSRRFDEWQKTKGNQPATSPFMENEILSQIGKMIDEKLAVVSASFSKSIDELKAAHGVALGRIDEVSTIARGSADQAAIAAVKEFAKTLGAPAGSAAAPSVPAAAPIAKKFETLVREHSEYAKSKTSAIKAVIAAHGDAYREYQSRIQNKGEVTMF